MLARGAAVPAVAGADRHVGVGVDVSAAVGGTDHQLAHVAEAGVVARPPRRVARRAQPLRRAVGEDLEAGMAGEKGHPRVAVAGQREHPALLDQRVGRQHLVGRRHRGQALQRGGQQRRGLLARAGERRTHALERVARLALGPLARDASRLHPVPDQADHGLEKGQRVGGLHDVGLGPAPLLVDAHERLHLLHQPGLRSLLAQPLGHDAGAALLVPAVVGGVVPGDGRVPARLVVGVGPLGVVGHRRDAHRLARPRVDELGPVQGALHVAVVRMHLGHPGTRPFQQLGHVVTGRAWST